MDKRLLISWVNASQFHAPNGWKTSGIEHRIMREAGLVENVRGRDLNGIGETMVKCANIVACEYSLEVKALHAYALSGFRIAHVKNQFKLTTRDAHRLLERAWPLMHAAYLVMKSISYVNDGER